jgi:hypothetical protein
MTRKEKIVLIRAGIEPEKKARYKLSATTYDCITFDVDGIDLFTKEPIIGKFTKNQIDEFLKANEGVKDDFPYIVIWYVKTT